MFAQRGCPTSRATASAVALAAFRMSLGPYFRLAETKANLANSHKKLRSQYLWNNLL